MMMQGAFAAMMTPRTADGTLDLNAVAEMTEFIIQNGASGLFPVSNVGGMIHMRMSEKAQMIKTVVTQAHGRVPVFPGISASSTAEAVALGEMCARLSADGCVLSAPYYFPYPQSVVLSGLTAVVRQVPLPVVLYNIPKYAGEITLDSFRMLMQEKNVCGAKDSSGSMANLLNLLSLRDAENQNFSVFTGWEEMTFSALTAGAQGCMCASGGIFPEIMRDICAYAGKSQNDYALRCQRLIARATAVFGQVFFPLGYQWAMEARGIAMGAYPVAFDESGLAPQRESIWLTVKQTLENYQALKKEYLADS